MPRTSASQIPTKAEPVSTPAAPELSALAQELLERVREGSGIFIEDAHRALLRPRGRLAWPRFLCELGELERRGLVCSAYREGARRLFPGPRRRSSTAARAMPQSGAAEVARVLLDAERPLLASEIAKRAVMGQTTALNHLSALGRDGLVGIEAGATVNPTYRYQATRRLRNLWAKERQGGAP